MNDLLDYGPDGLTLVTARERIRELEAALREANRHLAGHVHFVTADGLLNNIIAPAWAVVRSALEPPVSTLCAVCDQIKELHPATHPWTPRPTAETKGDQT